VTYVDDQSRISANELPTDGYTMVNAALTCTVRAQSTNSCSPPPCNRPTSNGAEMASVQAGVRKARALCANKGETLTPLRQRVLEIVLSNRMPVKAYDILRELQREQEKAAPPTAYRALDLLVALGIVHRIESLSAYVGGTHEEPGHGGLFFVCEKCHPIIEAA
jgi:Fur family transcriptional regulator, zinc uptake regulator